MVVAQGAPVGTIALLFTDIEGSTRLAGDPGEGWPEVLAEHHAIVGGAIAAEGGFVDGSEGDSFFATFVDAGAAARAAVAALRGLRSHSWSPTVGELKVRMGLHVGYVERAETGYVGLEVHRAARVAGAAHGGQLLMTSAARVLVGDHLATEPLGAHRLKDFPSPELLFCAVVDGRGAAFFPPPRTEKVRPTNLPAGLTAMVGREVELERIRDAVLVGGERLVTLTGRGGAGKTSLALAAAASLLDEHPGGVWLVRLAPVTSSEDVLPSVAGVVGAQAEGDRSVGQAIAQRFAAQGRTLLVLDNLEHLLPAAGSIVDLLEIAPELSVLVTSQAPLRVAGECCLEVGALDGGPARELVERVARRRRASFQVAEDDRAVLAEIVSMLDGLPLALELAAARLTLLRPAQLRDRLRSSSDVLRDDTRDRSDRHRSLRATVDWTLALVEAPARDLFVRIGAFAAPAELEELELVCGADGLNVLDALAGLVDVALVRRVEPGDGRVLFGLPEALRQTAAAMLDLAPHGERWRHAHAARQLELQWAARTLCAPRVVHAAAVAADAEAAAALQWARAVGDPLMEPLAAARGTLLAYSERTVEARAVLQPLIDSPPKDPLVQGIALIGYAMALSTLQGPARALDAAHAAVTLTGDDRALATALCARGLQYLALGQTEAALADHEQMTALARHMGPEALAAALTLESQTRTHAGQLDRAAELLEEVERIETTTDISHLPNRHTMYGDLALLREHPQEAMRHYVLSMQLAQQNNQNVQVYFDAYGLATALAMNRDDREALEVYGIAEAQIMALGGSLESTWRLGPEDPLREARERLGADAAAEARQRGLSVDAGYRVTRACELARAPRP